MKVEPEMLTVLIEEPQETEGTEEVTVSVEIKPISPEEAEKLLRRDH